jgi:5-formyltetrahydrofolate cyclo-ligase
MNITSPDLTAWRRARRSELIERRLAASPEEREAWDVAIEATLETLLRNLRPALLGFYWPMRAEFDPRPLVLRLHAEGLRAALPAISQPRAPMHYRPWAPDAPMVPGVYEIPVPQDTTMVKPDVVLAPLVGFDPQKFRLGYGGGYFDRTLAALAPKPVTIGVGYELARLPSVQPHDFDLPMDHIVTEAGLFS